MREYKISKGWAIFIYIFAPLIIALFVWFLIMPILKEDIPIEFMFFTVPISLGIIGYLFVGLLDAIKGKLIIVNNTISIRSTFINRDLKYEEVEGFKIEDRHIFIQPNTTKKKRIKISTYIGKTDELILWLTENFKDLHDENEIKEEKEILKNHEFGINENERAGKLKRAKLIAKVLNWTGGIVALWTFFFANPYEYAIIASITLPLISILVVIYYKGLIRIDEKKGSSYPTVFFSIFMTSCGLGLRALVDFNIMDYSNVWLPTSFIAIGLIALILLTTKELKLKKRQEFFTLFSLLLFFFGYGYGVVVTTNCYFDKGSPSIFEAEIIEKRMSTGKSIIYYFMLTPWGNQTESDEVLVSKQFYKSMEVGDSVNVFLKEGNFGIPWIIVTE